MTEQPAPLAQLIHHLHAQGRLRVWSVIVTILGELAEPEGGELSMSALLELCAALEIEPQAVRTAMTAVGAGDGGVAGLDGMLEPEQLANTVIETLEKEEFLVLPHPEVLRYMRRKTDDYDRWLGGMRRLNDKFEDAYRKREESQD